jgi:hypothetical protein
MLWQFFPRDFCDDLEEGITETIDQLAGPYTNWRKPSDAVVFSYRFPSASDR